MSGSLTHLIINHKYFYTFQINPTGQVPAIDDNGFYLGESRAIALYLCNKYHPDNDLYPFDPERRAQVDHMLYFDAATFYPVFVQCFVCIS